MVSFFFGTFQMVVLALTNVCEMVLIPVPSFLNFKMAYLSPIDSSLVYMIVYHF